MVHYYYFTGNSASTGQPQCPLCVCSVFANKWFVKASNMAKAKATWQSWGTGRSDSLGPLMEQPPTLAFISPLLILMLLTGLADKFLTALGEHFLVSPGNESYSSVTSDLQFSSSTAAPAPRQLFTQGAPAFSCPALSAVSVSLGSCLPIPHLP